MPAQPTPSAERAAVGPRYKWIALTNTTAGSVMAMLDGSIVIIAMPAIFRGLDLDPLSPTKIGYLLLSLDPLSGGHGAVWLIAWRFVQAFGGSMLTANCAAILTDAFPRNQRGFALGINQMAGKEFFPDLISQPFHDGLVVFVAAAAVLAGLGGLGSLLRGPRPVPAVRTSRGARASAADRTQGAGR